MEMPGQKSLGPEPRREAVDTKAGPCQGWAEGAAVRKALWTRNPNIWAPSRAYTWPLGDTDLSHLE